MRLVTNERYLQLILGALGKDIIPELQTDSTRATADIVRTVVSELLLRERKSAELLATELEQGFSLAADLSCLLDRLEPHRSAQAATVVMPLQDDFPGRLDSYTQLNVRIAELAEAVASLRPKCPDADEQKVISELLKRAAQWEMSFYRSQRSLMADAANAATDNTPTGGRLDQTTLESFLRQVHPDGDSVSIVDYQSVPGGYGKQTSRFALREASGDERPLIARKSDQAPMVLNRTFLIDHEYALLQAVSATGYPAPRPLWLGREVAGVDADFYIMERLPGRIPGSFLGGAEGGISEALLLDVATQLARLHAIPLSSFDGYIRQHDDSELLAEGSTGSVQSCYRRAIEQWHDYSTRVEHLPSPYFTYLHDWLLNNLPEDSRQPVLVHGDFNVHNLLVEGDRVTGVLDWECAMFGAPEQDLAYIRPHISRHIAWDKFLAHYHEAGGRRIDTDSLPFYMAFSMMRLHLGMNHGLLNLQTGANPDIRFAMIELAFAPQMMEMGLGSTLATQ